jgi:hypothetical protein
MTTARHTQARTHTHAPKEDVGRHQPPLDGHGAAAVLHERQQRDGDENEREKETDVEADEITRDPRVEIACMCPWWVRCKSIILH